MYTITEIEDAIISTLQNSPMGSYCKKIDSFQIEGGDIEEQIRIFAGQVPCVLVIYAGGEFSHGVGESREHKMSFSILVAAQSLRGDGDARRGAVGTYQMISDLNDALTFSRCGLEIDELLPIRVTPEINTKSFSAYSVDFETTVYS